MEKYVVVFKDGSVEETFFFFVAIQFFFKKNAKMMISRNCKDHSTQRLMQK